jgi:hypothetical protein
MANKQDGGYMAIIGPAGSVTSFRLVATPEDEDRAQKIGQASNSTSLRLVSAPQDEEQDRKIGQGGNRAIFRRVKSAASEAVRDLLESLPDNVIECLTFDLSIHRWSATDLAIWITEFKRGYKEEVISKGKAALIPSIAVFADRFSSDEENTLRNVGAVLFDRSLRCNEDCLTSGQFLDWLAKNSQITMAATSQLGTDLPSAPANGISPEDLKALNTNPAGMTEDQLRQILKTLNSH